MTTRRVLAAVRRWTLASAMAIGLVAWACVLLCLAVVIALFGAAQGFYFTFAESLRDIAPTVRALPENVRLMWRGQ